MIQACGLTSPLRDSDAQWHLGIAALGQWVLALAALRILGEGLGTKMFCSTLDQINQNLWERAPNVDAF